jgi:hypothetical protein
MTKFRVTMKCPDALHDACQEAAKDYLESVSGIDDKDRELLLDNREGYLLQSAAKWFRHYEYLTVEIDTSAGTCVVIPDKS